MIESGIYAASRALSGVLLVKMGGFQGVCDLETGSRLPHTVCTA